MYFKFIKKNKNLWRSGRKVNTQTSIGSWPGNTVKEFLCRFAAVVFLQWKSITTRVLVLVASMLSCVTLGKPPYLTGLRFPCPGRSEYIKEFAFSKHLSATHKDAQCQMEASVGASVGACAPWRCHRACSSQWNTWQLIALSQLGTFLLPQGVNLADSPNLMGISEIHSQYPKEWACISIQHIFAE